jgi:hypothetical protein
MKLNNEFILAWNADGPFDELLTRFVAATESRASGLWRLEENELVLLGFGWASDMPQEVSMGFQEATRRVPLSQTGLGIVKAIVSGKPAIGRRDPQENGLSGSATWIAKFGANTSLAVPIRDAQATHFIGVLAVSTETFVEEGDALWQTMLEISKVLGVSS